MPADHPEQEPSIEEILASIRQIISDDDDDEPAESPPAKKSAKDDDILELTDKVDEEPDESEDEPEPEPRKMIIDLQESADDEEDMGESVLTDTASRAAFDGFSKLASRAMLDRRGTGDTTIEDIVREMMRPMLREWLDIHLPPLIEKVVKQELQKVARRAVEDE